MPQSRGGGVKRIVKIEENGCKSHEVIIPFDLNVNVTNGRITRRESKNIRDICCFVPFALKSFQLFVSKTPLGYVQIMIKELDRVLNKFFIH
jgi:hypothetical protein